MARNVRFRRSPGQLTSDFCHPVHIPQSPRRPGKHQTETCASGQYPWSEGLGQEDDIQEGWAASSLLPALESDEAAGLAFHRGCRRNMATGASAQSTTTFFARPPLSTSGPGPSTRQIYMISTKRGTIMVTSLRSLNSGSNWRARRRALRRNLLSSIAIGAAAAALPAGLEPGAAEAVNSHRCSLPEGALDVTDLPAGRSVLDCAAVGREVSIGSTGLTIPEPGIGVSVDGLTVSGKPQHFQLEVSAEGLIAYPARFGARNVARPEISIMSPDPAPCTDAAYSIYDYSERDVYAWHIGDGGMPGALSRSATQKAFLDAINNITESYSDCRLADQVSAGQKYSGTTPFEGDFASGSLKCTKRDKVSTWDAGDLNGNVVAGACVWYAVTGGAPDVVEADVRYNTADFNFTNDPNSGPCKNRYDIRAVGTHEAGHIFGIGHVSDGHSNLTMYTNAFMCNTKARTLGFGDVLGLRMKY